LNSPRHTAVLDIPLYLKSISINSWQSDIKNCQEIIDIDMKLRERNVCAGVTIP